MSAGVLDRCDLMADFSRERFCEVLDACGMTQQKIAEKSGVAQGTISQYRTGYTSDPRASHVFRIADAVGVSCDVFRQAVGMPIRWLPGRKPKK